MDHYQSPHLRGYSEEIHFALEVGEGPTLRQARHQIATTALTPDEQSALAVFDEYVIDAIVNLESVQNYLLRDNDLYPLNNWWWHLGKLRAGTYPAHLLPEHLRAIYQPAAQRDAA